MKKFFIAVCVLLFSIGCNSASDISSETVCGNWDMYLIDTGRNGEEQKQPIIYTFLPDGSYVCRIEDSMKEDVSNGKWEIKEGKLLLRDAANNIVAYTYGRGQRHTFSHTACQKEFFPKGLTFVLRKQ